MVNLYNMKASELHRELLKKGAVTFRRQTLDSHIKNGKIPYWLDDHKRKKFCYQDSLAQLVLAGLAQRVTIDTSSMKPKDLVAKLHSDRRSNIITIDLIKEWSDNNQLPFHLNKKGKKRFEYETVLKILISARWAK